MVLVVTMAFSILDGLEGGGRTVDLRQGDGHARALALEMDLLGIIPIESICTGINLVLEHCLGHGVEWADSDVGGGVVVTHDGP